MERPTDVAIGFNELYLTISGRRYIAPENEALWTRRFLLETTIFRVSTNISS